MSGNKSETQIDTEQITVTADIHQSAEPKADGSGWRAVSTEDDWEIDCASTDSSSEKPESVSQSINSQSNESTVGLQNAIDDPAETQLSAISKLISSSMRIETESSIENIDSQTNVGTSYEQENGTDQQDIAGELPRGDHKASESELHVMAVDSAQVNRSNY